jgi:hypothetical protein
MKIKAQGRIGAGVILVSLVALFLLNGAVQARVLAFYEVRAAATRLLQMENARPDLRLSQDTFTLAGIEPLIYQNRQVAFLVRLKPVGFMILSDISEVTPQVFVSFSGTYEALSKHPFLVRILDHLEYAKVHLRYIPPRLSQDPGVQPADVPDRELMARNDQVWAALANPAEPAAGLLLSQSLTALAVSPLLTTTWNQNEPYWNHTPRVSGTPTYTGCSATAMAQVMYYWRCPLQGQGSHSYHWNGQTLSANFNHSYPWEQMLPSYSSGYTDEQAEAVSRLMSDVGISINMNYGTDGSSAVPNANHAFSAFFKYGGDSHYVYRSHSGSWTNYFNAVKQQLDIAQPVILGIFKPGSGHAVVADGYRTSPSNEAHVNMGWGGSQDNYYSMDNIYGYGDAHQDYAVVSVHPTQVHLNIVVTGSGTTTPAPGSHAYSYSTNKVVQVTASPNPQFEFLRWTGDASGSQNPLNVLVNREKTVTAVFGHFIRAPLDAAGQKVLNRSASQAEYINVLTFAANPANVDIQGYRIYAVENGQQTEVATVDASTFTYWHRNVQRDKTYVYNIVAVNNEPREGDPAVVVVY